ncbi:pyridoxal-phosphate dependent enzyme [uncultured Brevibacterium sp.]|uniref:pyridoxal-phosphate dependent enzyme n=1 Tax=uncultured Brevibacterium sp. TaxID=189678 RepID=UPI0025F02308|nr:pyridoxal-phosphate dependent enzyme [uncultured Brevibacterium sp.]
MKYADTVLDLVGSTPLVKLNSVASGVRATVLAKLEYMNPSGSIKDRIAVSLVADAERSGKLAPGGTIVEPTSGNTGVGLAMVAAIRGYDAVFVTPDKVGKGKRDVLSAYGAEVVVTKTNVAPDSPESYYGVSDRITAEREGAFKPDQFSNQAGPEAHYRTTGPEIWNDTDGRVTHVVMGPGTGGTITGTGRYLHEASEGRVKVVAADPAGSIYADHSADLHSYYVEGVGEDMIPDTYDPSVPDGFVTVDDAAAFEMTRRLAVEEGLLVGGSSGMAVVAALETARELDEDAVVVVVLPDSGRGYIDKIFNDEWMAEHGFTTAARRGGDVVAAPGAEVEDSEPAGSGQPGAGHGQQGASVADVVTGLGITPGDYPCVGPDTRLAEAVAALSGDVLLVADPGAATEFNVFGAFERSALTSLLLDTDDVADVDTAVGTLTHAMIDLPKVGVGQPAEVLRAHLLTAPAALVYDAGRPVALIDRTALARWAASRKDHS